MELLIAVGLFGMIFGIAYFTLASRPPIAEDAVPRPLDTIALQPRPSKPVRLEQTEAETFWEQVAGFFLGAKDMPETYNRISRRLHQAGYRGVRAVRIFWGLRIFLCLAFGFGGLVASVSSNARMSDMLLLGGAGAFLWCFFSFLALYRKAKARVLEMRATLPDTLG